jgi:hypothetical protein
VLGKRRYRPFKVLEDSSGYATYQELGNKPKRLREFERDIVRLTLQTLRLPYGKVCVHDKTARLAIDFADARAYL